ncbi:MAG TPA: pyrroloquinoline quinone biosynthesis protein PqqB [Gemmatimonadales bacterium]|jgi:pyrroloquinoline quinone biosynthesis protein B|nr:pyrroloquinoline quinone biosynthesis protein PqqB [Gemmatimonadales bacterium]
MRVIVLGSAAGGGVPQWNCGCAHCADARQRGARRTQSSVALSADGERWILLNASPDIGAQLAAHRALWPRSGRDTPLRAVILTDGEIDHTLGLVLLRENAARLPVYAPAAVTALLQNAWPLYPVLSAYAGVDPRLLPDDGASVALADRAGVPLGIATRAVAVARRAPRFASTRTRALSGALGACAVGLRLVDDRTGGVLAYIPTAGAVDDAVRQVAQDADLLLFDGTFWSDDELRRAGVDAPAALEMGHVPVGGPGGSAELLPQLGAKRTLLVHLNNTNPLLHPAGPERAALARTGIAVADDGMEFEL